MLCLFLRKLGGGQCAEGVRIAAKTEGSSVIPFHVDITAVIDVIHRSSRTGRHGMVGIVHTEEQDAGAGRILRSVLFCHTVPIIEN